MIDALLGRSAATTNPDPTQQTGRITSSSSQNRYDILNTTFDTVPPMNGSLHP